MSEALAAIDVGTNSIHLVVARPVEGGPPDILTTDKDTVRLGSGGRDMKQIDSAAINRAVLALDRFRQIAAAHDADIVAIATSAVREADNAREFIDRARTEAGVDVEVISGVEEARLIHLGALQAVPVADRRHVVIDIGGGSTEIVIGEATTPLLARSLKLGHIRLTDRFFPGGVIEAGSVKACRKHVRAFLAPAALEVADHGFEVAVGCSGTIETAAAMIAGRRGDEPVAVANQRFTYKELVDLVNELVTRERPKDRASMPGLEEGRRDVVVAGLVLLRELCKSLGIDEMVLSDAALREGIVFDRLRRRADGGIDSLHHLSDLRRSSALAVARRYEEDLSHAAHATDLALELFHETSEAHGLELADADLLEAAGLLHNVGRFVSYAAHHKHSYYVIRHAEQLAGFTEHERELIALVARYHRKSAPKEKHPEFAILDEADRHRIRTLAGLLRVGIGLDRTYRRAVVEVHASVSDDTIEIAANTGPRVDIELELFTATDRAGLLADALGRRVTIDQREDQLAP